MTYVESHKIQIGDIVLTRSNERHRVTDIQGIPDKKILVFQLDNGNYYDHTTIAEIEPKDAVPRKYYQILAFNPPDVIDDVCSTHIYPTYVSCMSVKSHLVKPCSFDEMSSHPTMLQGNPNDGLKFVDFYNARKMLEIVQQRFPQKEFNIIEVDALCFGRIKHRWVVSL